MPLPAGFVAKAGLYSVIRSLEIWLKAQIPDETIVAFSPLPPASFPCITINDPGLYSPQLTGYDFQLTPDPTGWGTASDRRGFEDKTLVEFDAWVNLEQRSGSPPTTYTGGDISRMLQMADKVLACILRSGHNSHEYGATQGANLIDPPQLFDFSTSPAGFRDTYVEFDFTGGSLSHKTIIDSERPHLRREQVRVRVKWWHEI